MAWKASATLTMKKLAYLDLLVSMFFDRKKLITICTFWKVCVT